MDNFDSSYLSIKPKVRRLFVKIESWHIGDLMYL